jgi:hypothetical protein
MAGTNVFVMSERVFNILVSRGMDLRCKCSFNCHKMIAIHDSVVSKPSKKGRKYYLLDHYNDMMIDLNGYSKDNGLDSLDDIEDNKETGLEALDNIEDW